MKTPNLPGLTKFLQDRDEWHFSGGGRVECQRRTHDVKRRIPGSGRLVQPPLVQEGQSKETSLPVGETEMAPRDNGTTWDRASDMPIGKVCSMDNGDWYGKVSMRQMFRVISL
jgi:hypothetical protein